MLRQVDHAVIPCAARTSRAEPKHSPALAGKISMPAMMRTMMAVTIIVTAIIVLIIAGMLIFPANAGECFGSAREVRAAHGMTAWSTWRSIDGQKCYMLGKRKEVVRSEYRGSVRSVSAGLSRHEITPRPSTPAGAIPLPRPRLEGMITPHL